MFIPRISTFTILILLGCAQIGWGAPPNPADPRRETDLATSINRFGWRLFQNIAVQTEPDSNICLSPLSASCALAMTCSGAAGKTREAMASVLEIPVGSIDDVNRQFRELVSRYARQDSTGNIDIANSIWHRPEIVLEPDFVGMVRDHFFAIAHELDFGAAWAADTINKWVSISTHDKIQEIIDPPINPAVVMYLINAVHFQAPWMIPFDPNNTYTGRFTLPAGNAIDCRMMKRTGEYSYYADGSVQIIDLPYGRDNFSMTVMLPASGLSIDDFVSHLGEYSVENWVDNMQLRTLVLHFPKFAFSADHGLDSSLIGMGMGIAFDGTRADFSRMVIKGRIWIDSVIHKTFIRVDEEGTEAAAVTAVAMEKGLSPKVIVDRPFIFAIRERETGTILFLGKMVRPVWEEE